MKKLTLILTLVLGMTMATSAQNGGLFRRGTESEESSDGFGYRDNDNGSLISLPTQHGQTEDEDAPLGSGIAVFAGFGAAYAFLKSKKRK